MTRYQHLADRLEEIVGELNGLPFDLLRPCGGGGSRPTRPDSAIARVDDGRAVSVEKAAAVLRSGRGLISRSSLMASIDAAQRARTPWRSKSLKAMRARSSVVVLAALDAVRARRAG